MNASATPATKVPTTIIAARYTICDCGFALFGPNQWMATHPAKTTANTNREIKLPRPPSSGTGNGLNMAQICHRTSSRARADHRSVKQSYFQTETGPKMTIAAPEAALARGAVFYSAATGAGAGTRLRSAGTNASVITSVQARQIISNSPMLAVPG